MSLVLVVLSHITMHSQTVTGTGSVGFQSACAWLNTAKQPGGVISRKPDFGFVVLNKSIEEMVQWAFGGWTGQRFLVFGGLDWTRHDRFHVEIRFPGHTSTEQNAAMLRDVLRAVFKLSVHWETRGAIVDWKAEPVDVLVVEPVEYWETALDRTATTPYCIEGALLASGRH
jgi:hypothetical protein